MHWKVTLENGQEIAVGHIQERAYHEVKGLKIPAAARTCYLWVRIPGQPSVFGGPKQNDVPTCLGAACFPNASRYNKREAISAALNALWPQLMKLSKTDENPHGVLVKSDRRRIFRALHTGFDVWIDNLGKKITKRPSRRKLLTEAALGSLSSLEELVKLGWIDVSKSDLGISLKAAARSLGPTRPLVGPSIAPVSSTEVKTTEKVHATVGAPPPMSRLPIE